MGSATALKGSRLDLALVLAEREERSLMPFSGLTANELAAAVGRPTGSIFGVLRRMHQDGILSADTDPEPPTRGTQYRLSADGAEMMHEALVATSSAGELTDKTELLFVRCKRLAPAVRVLERPSYVALIDWGTTASDGVLLALKNDADDLRVHALVAALEETGAKCTRTRTGLPRPGGLFVQQLSEAVPA